MHIAYLNGEMSDRVDLVLRMLRPNRKILYIHTALPSSPSPLPTATHPPFPHPGRHSELVAPFEHTYTYTGKGRKEVGKKEERKKEARGRKGRADRVSLAFIFSNIGLLDREEVG